jgi:hypothetical protein
MKQTFALLALTALVLSGCVTSQPRPTRSEFEDIPVPRGLAYVEDQSTIIESPSVKAARLIYRGRIEINSLNTAMKQTMEANGWRSVSNTTSGGQGTTQVYEKNGSSLQVKLWESWYYTYVELTASRAMGASTATK